MVKSSTCLWNATPAACVKPMLMFENFIAIIRLCGARLTFGYLSILVGPIRLENLCIPRRVTSSAPKWALAQKSMFNYMLHLFLEQSHFNKHYCNGCRAQIFLDVQTCLLPILWVQCSMCTITSDFTLWQQTCHSPRGCIHPHLYKRERRWKQLVKRGVPLGKLEPHHPASPLTKSSWPALIVSIS